MKQCVNGHIYDETIHAACPYCSNNVSLSGIGAPSFPTAQQLNSPSFPRTESLNSPAFPKTEPLNAPEPKVKKDMSPTVALNVNRSGIDPVRGWLVVVSGSKSGKSFEIHSEKNTVGRGASFDVDLAFDPAVSKEGDVNVSYDARNHRFFLSPAAGKNNVYHNEQLLLAPVELKDYDTLEVGSTKLVFRSFCNSEFDY